MLWKVDSYGIGAQWGFCPSTAASPNLEESHWGQGRSCNIIWGLDFNCEYKWSSSKLKSRQDKHNSKIIQIRHRNIWYNTTSQSHEQFFFHCIFITLPFDITCTKHSSFLAYNKGLILEFKRWEFQKTRQNHSLKIHDYRADVPVNYIS